MAKPKNAARSKVAGKKRPASGKKAVKTKTKFKKATPRKASASARKAVAAAAKKQPKKLTPKQFAAKLKADTTDARDRENAAAKAAKLTLAAAAADAKPKTRQRLTAKEKALVREFERKELSPLEAEARRMRLDHLIVLGKERGYLT